MGGVEAGIGTANRTSPRQAAIQKVQAELRQEYDVREERKRELEFLERGGNPLDFKLGNAASVSVQSTSYPDQYPASEAKGSFALTASTHGDSVETSGDRNSLHPSRNNIVPSEHSSQIDVSHKAVELKDSAAFGIPRKAYKRRNRSRPTKDGAKLNSADVKGSVSEGVQQDMKLDSVKVVRSTRDLNDGDPNTPIQLDSNGPEAIQKMEEKGSAVGQTQSGLTASKAEKRAKPIQMNGFSSRKGDGIDGNDSEMCTNTGNAESNGNTMNQTLVPENSRVIEDGEFIKDKKDTEGTSSGSSLKRGVKDHSTTEGMKDCGPTGSEPDKIHADVLGQNPAPQNDACCNVRLQDSIDTTISDINEAGSLIGVSTVSVVEAQASKPESKMTNVVDEDKILEEAQLIEANRKRIMELSMMTAPTEIRRKSQWDHVLEEMAWLANDFAQERIWKISAAAQVCHQVAFTCRKRKQDQVSAMATKNVAHTLAKAVMEFWHSVEEKCEENEQQSQKDATVSVQTYAVRFLKHNNSNIFHDQVQMPLTPDRISDLGTMDLSWEDSLTEENLFYSIPAGAMETYRKSIESHVEMCERNGGNAQEEVETSPFDTVADFNSQYNAFYDDEGETSTYDKSSRFGQKKQKHAFVTQQPSFLVKRPGNSLNVSIPTKRVRTASRRVISPFDAGTSGCVQFPSKTDISSGDTDSFQDDQSTLGGGSLVPFDAESVGDFENQLPFDSAEVSTKPKKKKKKKKKKKAKNLNAHEQRWQVNSGFQHEQFQKDHFKRRTESHQFESNNSIGLLGQPPTKKPKIMRPSHDNSFNNITPTSGSVPSPVTSQMSNMSNPNKFVKMLSGRDRGRKPKAHKVPAGQAGSGSGWSIFEEQSLVVLVHDLGPNWELVSDAFNSTFHFKCMFRNAQECKERHKTLVDITSGDGADSADDSGSSQPYPSTLPGIPMGSARQLFQRLQGPIEEETLKSHFEKIIMISQKRHCRKALQDRVHLQQPHSSHTVALSQVCQNNLNGGPIFTPFDLCATTVTGPDIPPLGYQGPPSSGVAVPNQNPLSPMLPVSGANSSLQGFQNMMIGNNLPSSPLSSSVSRDGRYVVPKSASLSTDEQHRMQRYNYMVSNNRNVAQQPNNISSPGAHPGIDRTHIVPGNNGMGMVVNRSMPMARPPGLQGFGSPSMVNSGSMVSPVTAPATMQGSSMPRPREASHIMRPGLNQDSQRKTVRPDLQMPGNNQAASHFGGLSSATASPPVPTYTVHHQLSPRPLSPQQPQLLSPRHPHFQGPPDHVPGPHQQAYAIRLAKEKQLQQRFLPQKQSNSLMPPQIPLPSPPPMQQNTTQMHASTPSSSMNSMAQQKHPIPNQTGKQRPKQQLSQANRQHPLQRELSQGKVAKGVATTNQNIPVDPSQLNGVSINPNVSQCLDRGEPANSVPHAMQPKRQYVPSQSPNQPLPQQNKRPQEISYRSENSTQGHYSQSVAPPQSIPSVAMASNHQKLMNQNQLPVQRIVPPNRQINSDQHPTNTSAEMDKEPTLPQATSAVRIVSPATTNQLQSPDPLLGSNELVSAPNSSSSVSTPSNASGSIPQGPNLHSHQQAQAQLLEAGIDNLNGRPSDPGLE